MSRQTRNPRSTRPIRVLGANLLLSSDEPSLIMAPEYFGGTPHPLMRQGLGWEIRCQEANCRLEYPDAPPERIDSSFEVHQETGTGPRLEVAGDRVVAVGDWLDLETRTRDRRYSLFGNQGVLFRHLLTVLERRGVYSFHACGLVEKTTGRVCLVLGERGSGKSALLLAALASGRFLTFGTEIVHAGLEEGRFVFYRGSVRNNIRLGHLLYDFPGLVESLGVGFAEVANPWNTKVQLDLAPFGVSWERLDDPELHMIIPRIEENLGEAWIDPVPVDDLGRVKRTLVENLSDKIVSLALAYECLPVGSLDTTELLQARIAFVDGMLATARFRAAHHLFASPKNCLEGL